MDTKKRINDCDIEKMVGKYLEDDKASDVTTEELEEYLKISINESGGTTFIAE